jgi:NAD(P)H-dependent FMN reductase
VEAGRFEHNGSYTAAWKNIYDWMSRIDMAVYQGKKVAMFAVTPGPRGGAGVLGNAVPAAPFFGADLVGSLGIPMFYENFDAEAGELIDPDVRNRFEDPRSSRRVVGVSAGRSGRPQLTDAG